jgi:hypothetical protein
VRPLRRNRTEKPMLVGFLSERREQKKKAREPTDTAFLAVGCRMPTLRVRATR